jgi:hypothetical protein
MSQGQSDFYEDNVVYREFKPFFDLEKTILDFGNQSQDDVKPWSKDESFESYLRDVMSRLYSSSLKTFLSILFLCNKGHGENAMSLVRTIFDNYLTLRYIQQNPSDSIYKFLNYPYLEKKFMLDRAEQPDGKLRPDVKIMVLEKEMEILDQYHQVKILYVKQGEDEEKSLKKFKSGKWAGVSRRRMAEDTCLAFDYDYVFHFHSHFTHPHPMGLSGFCEETELEVRYGAKPSAKEVFPALPVAMRYFLLILKEWAELFQLNKGTEIEAFLNEVTKLETEHINRMELCNEQRKNNY